jgi:hypothetical protein
MKTFFPTFQRITETPSLEQFALLYTQHSGFNVPKMYYDTNQVFGVYLNGKIFAGFVLGAGDRLRTLEVFSNDDHRIALYQQIQNAAPHTEICCFWMDPVCRKKTFLNFFVWLCVAYALRMYGTQQLIFGTNSARLAALYGASPKCKLVHRDHIHQKNTFIFTGPRRDCLAGVSHILWYKIKRLLQIKYQKHQHNKMTNPLTQC